MNKIILIVAAVFLISDLKASSGIEDPNLEHWRIGQQKGTTFVFANGTQLTHAKGFVAYETKGAKARADRFGGIGKHVVLGEFDVIFHVPEWRWMDYVRTDPLKYFMGVVPKEQGMISTAFTLEGLREQLIKLGDITQESTDDIKLDLKYPEAFAPTYEYLRLNCDEHGRRFKVEEDPTLFKKWDPENYAKIVAAQTTAIEIFFQ
jgi:hypothetical protein